VGRRQIARYMIIFLKQTNFKVCEKKFEKQISNCMVEFMRIQKAFCSINEWFTSNYRKIVYKYITNINKQAY